MKLAPNKAVGADERGPAAPSWRELSPEPLETRREVGPLTFENPAREILESVLDLEERFLLGLRG